MCLRFIFPLITHVTSWLRLSHREDAWKTTEILILRRQLAVQQWGQLRRPNLNWTDRPTRTRQNIRALVPRLARENPEWGTAGSTANWLAWE